jgi:carboxyl-terminal processing protease
LPPGPRSRRQALDSMPMRTRWFLALGVGLGALAAGFWVLTQPKAKVSAETPVVGTELFETVFSHVKSFSVDSLSDQELYQRAAVGVIDELGDPYAVLLLPGREPPPPEDAPAPQGLYLDRRDGLVVVVATIKGSPAEMAGLRSGDRLVGIDSILVDDTRLDQVARLLDGPVGTSVALRVRRAGTRAILLVDVLRGRSPRVGAVETSVLGGGVGRVMVRRFPSGVEDSVRSAVESLRGSGVRSLVLDLRGAVGGDITQGVALADLFLDTGTTIVESKSRQPGSSRSFTDSVSSPFDSLPMTVLVDEGTAGAAEVVAGALQDHDRVAVLGAVTFGRGVTQSTFLLGNGASLRLTTALWITPRGRQIQTPPRPADGDSVPRPRLTSDGGRELLGGGGIVPDRLIAQSGSGDTVLAQARSILVRAGSTRAVLALVTPR